MKTRKNYGDYKFNALTGEAIRSAIKEFEIEQKHQKAVVENWSGKGKKAEQEKLDAITNKMQIAREKLNDCPPAPRDFGEVKCLLIMHVNDTIKDAEDTIADFKGRVITDPLIAIEWHTENIAEAVVQLKEATYWRGIFEKGVNFEEMFAWADERLEQANDNIISTAGRGARSSTNPVANAIENYKNAAYASFYSGCSSVALTWYYWMIEYEMAVKAYEEVNK
jgi:hypothetical protein